MHANKTGTPKFRGSGCQFPQSQCHPSPRTGIALGTRLVLPWNFRKFSCKIYPIPWNFLVKFGPVHGISMCKLLLPMEFPSWDIYSWKFPSNIYPPMEFPSHEIYPSLWKFLVRITPPLGNSRTWMPPSLEIPGLMHPLPWKFQG